MKLHSQNELDIQSQRDIIFSMYKFCENYNIAMGYGVDWFNPQTAIKDYKIDFYELEFMKDYKTSFSAIIDGKGAKPTLDIRFTDEGIKKLIANNDLIVQEIKNQFNEIIGDLKDEELLI